MGRDASKSTRVTPATNSEFSWTGVAGLDVPLKGPYALVNPPPIGSAELIVAARVRMER